MKVLLTGGNGFIGSYVLDQLLAEGATVYSLARRRAPWHSEHPRLHWFPGDLCTPLSLPPGTQADLCIHLGAANDVASRDPKTAHLTTVVGTQNVVDLCARTNIPRIAFFSTFQVFGNVLGEANDQSPVQCLNDYALTHYFAEQVLEKARLTHGTDYLVLRPTNVYGPLPDVRCDRFSLVPACLVKEAHEFGQITLKSSGRQTRDWIHLNELWRQLRALLEPFDGTWNRKYILAGEATLEIRSVARLVAERYEAIYDAPCALDIQSEQPQPSTPLSVTASNLRSAGIIPGGTLALEESIDSLFSALRAESARRAGHATSESNI